VPAQEIGSVAVPELDRLAMLHALRLARAAGRRGEVPVGAVILARGDLIAAASNRVERAHDATAHAELLALRQASRKLDSWRLQGCTLYSTLEPCPMCAGALLLARIDRVVYGAEDPRKGAYRSVYDVLGNPVGNHHPEVTAGCEAAASSALLQGFFQRLRAEAN
jgi:tRNA(adenine34) deaminase